MVAFTEYAFSWYTLAAIGVYFVFAIAVYRRVRDHHPELHERFGGHRVWFSMPDQLRFFGFLFGFRYLQEHDAILSILASLMYLLGVIAAFLILTQPIYYRWHS
jgi:hypothetical protein